MSNEETTNTSNENTTPSTDKSVDINDYTPSTAENKHRESTRERREQKA